MAVTVQVQNVAHGCPAGGIEVRVERRTGPGWATVERAVTDDAGRLGGAWEGGVVRLVFEAEKFFASLGLPAVVAEVSTALRVGPGEDHRVSVLLAPVACTISVEAS